MKRINSNLSNSLDTVQLTPPTKQNSDLSANETIPSVNVDYDWQRGNFSVRYCSSQYVNPVS